MSKTREKLLTQFESLLKRIEDAGISKRIVAHSDDFELEQQVLALDEFIHEYENLQSTVEELELMEDISRLPTQDELRSVTPKIFDNIMKGEWDGTPDAIKRLLVRKHPELSISRTNKSTSATTTTKTQSKGAGCLMVLSALPLSFVVLLALFILLKTA